MICGIESPSRTRSSGCTEHRSILPPENLRRICGRLFTPAGKVYCAAMCIRPSGVSTGQWRIWSAECSGKVLSTERKRCLPNRCPYKQGPYYRLFASILANCDGNIIDDFRLNNHFRKLGHGFQINISIKTNQGFQR